ncbi:hypothetical protein [Nonomuraea dietziae]|uniref:hypothetical protein n=1 Tax=Nonomuraea dietziae TaxID=65515 RepID=UPI0031D57624
MIAVVVRQAALHCANSALGVEAVDVTGAHKLWRSYRFLYHSTAATEASSPHRDLLDVQRGTANVFIHG